MSLPITPPIAPQLAKSAKTLPIGDQWSYEPKWDGFRAIVFVDGSQTYIQSRNGKPLTKYFPELTFPKGEYVLDGEIVLFDSGGNQDFDALGQRIHPAQSRIDRLSKETPTTFIAFDLLAKDSSSLLSLPQEERRAKLENFLSQHNEAGTESKIKLTPSVKDPEDAMTWLSEAEGVVAKERGSHYRPGERLGMIKIKRIRTIDAVLIGWRPGKEPNTVGSLIIGLYNENNELRVVGHTSGFSAKEKRALVDRLSPFETGQRGTGGPSRWSADRDLEWIELRPELVVEVSFDHVSNNRIRHGTKLLRWRDDKDPIDCKIDQLYS